VRTICRCAERIRQVISYEIQALEWHQETAARLESTGKCELLSHMADEMEEQQRDQNAKAEAQYTDESAILEEKWTSALERERLQRAEAETLRRMWTDANK
jgi:tRNA C32,U32 (ribose-2'-O)-methylase TrmJ